MRGVEPLASAFKNANPGIVIVAPVAMGSSGGIGALIDGKLEVALSNRRPNGKELARVALVTLEYARTPFVVAVHKDLGTSWHV